MAKQDTTHGWTDTWEGTAGVWSCSVCGVLFNDGAAFYPCIGAVMPLADRPKMTEKPGIDWFALNRSGG